MSDAKDGAARENRMPLGEFSGTCRVEGMSLTIKADVQSVRYDAADPDARARMGRLIDSMLAQAAAAALNNVSAMLACLVKKDPEGAETIRSCFIKDAASLASVGRAARQQVVQTGRLVSKVILPGQEPPTRILKGPGARGR